MPSGTSAAVLIPPAPRDIIESCQSAADIAQFGLPSGAALCAAAILSGVTVGSPGGLTAGALGTNGGATLARGFIGVAMCTTNFLFGRSGRNG
jgi:hypothetical protein